MSDPPENSGSPTVVSPSAGLVSQVTSNSFQESFGMKIAQWAGSPSCA
jgi:hypothetical protein